MGTSVRRVRRLRTSPQSLVVAGSLARRPCDLRTWFPGPSRGSLLGPVWRFNLPLRARRNVRPGPTAPQRACPRTCDETVRSYPRTSDAMWTVCGYTRPGGTAWRRLLARLVAAQDGWAQPFGDFNHRWLSALFRPIRPIKDFLNGDLARATRSTRRRRTSRSARSSSTVILDLLGQPAAADIALVATILFMLGRRGLGRRRLHRHRRHGADPGDAPRDADGRRPRAPARLARSSGRPDRPTGPIPIALSIIAFLIVTAGAFVGGDVVYVFGNMVSRHAFRGAGTKWIKLDTGGRDRPRDAAGGDADQGEGRDQRPRPRPHRRRPCTRCTRCAPTPAARSPQGTVVDGCIECPWHGSRFRLTDGHVRRGPAVYDQPAYEIRTAEGGGYEVRRAEPEPDGPGHRMAHHPAMAEIVIADPSLVVLVGAAGAGKSTFAARHFAPTRSCRRTASGRSCRATRRTRPPRRRRSTCSTRRWSRASRAGRLAVVDATSIEPSARRSLLARATAAGVPATRSSSTCRRTRSWRGMRRAPPGSSTWRSSAASRASARLPRRTRAAHRHGGVRRGRHPARPGRGRSRHGPPRPDGRPPALGRAGRDAGDRRDREGDPDRVRRGSPARAGRPPPGSRWSPGRARTGPRRRPASRPGRPG